MNITEFTLLRHGLPHQADHLLGRTDPDLTERGWQQMQTSSAALKWDLILSSPLRRCRNFAASLATSKGQELIIAPQWQEVDFGDWDGMPIAQLWNDKQGYLNYWQQPFNHSPPGGETTAELIERLTTSIEQLSRQYAGKHLLIVTHSGVMRIVLAWLLDSRQRGNPHLSRLRLDHGATLSFSTYRDDQDVLWPQLLGLSNPEPSSTEQHHSQKLTEPAPNSQPSQCDTLDDKRGELA